MTTVSIDMVAVPTFVIDVEADGTLRIAAVNRSSEEATGYSAASTVGHTISECLPEGVARAVEARYRECIAKRSLHEYDETFGTGENAIWWRTSLTPLFDPSTGAVIRMIGVSIDITEYKRAEDLLQIEAETDPLTGLANRRCLERTFRSAMTQAIQDDRTFGLVLIDLDGFKPINDLLGHRKGDDVLRHVGSLLSLSMGKPGTVARIGGDEFAILLPAATEAELDGMAAALCRFLDRNISVAGIMTNLGASVGAALWTGGQTFEDLLEAADTAMYRQKAHRRSAA